jgi:hypothetical protein
MTSLDLDINNYSIKEIEKFFRIDENKKYTAADIELREVTIREQLIKSGHVDRRFIKDLIDFTQLAKDWLIFVKCPKEREPTTLPKNVKLDPYDYPRSAITHPTREGELITRENTPYVFTQSSEFFPGNLNPLNNRIITKFLNIDTKFRENYYDSDSSDFIIQLPTKLQKVVSMELASIELPLYFYYISKERGNNYLWIKVDYLFNVIINEKICIDSKLHCNTKSCIDVYSVENIIIIPDGNYSVTQLIDTINNMLCVRDEKGNRTEPQNILSYVQFAIDNTAQNYYGMGLVRVQGFDEMAGSIQNIFLDFSRGIDGNISKRNNGVPDNILVSTRLGWILGFQLISYCGEFIVADTFAQDAHFTYAYFAVDDFQNNTNNGFISSFQTSIFQPNILARLAFDTKDVETTYFSNNNNIVAERRNYFGPVDIQRLQFRFFDEYGRIIPMKHENYSFCLKFQIVYNL